MCHHHWRRDVGVYVLRAGNRFEFWAFNLIPEKLNHKTKSFSDLPQAGHSATASASFNVSSNYKVSVLSFEDLRDKTQTSAAVTSE